MDGILAGWNAGTLDGLDAAVTPNFRREASGDTATEGMEGIKKVMTNLRPPIRT